MDAGPIYAHRSKALDERLVIYGISGGHVSYLITAIDPQESVAEMNAAPETGRSTNTGSAYRSRSRAAAEQQEKLATAS